jgi:hypothetical protein
MKNQLHDFAPPIPPSGLFWTISIPAASAKIDLDKATASFSLHNLSIPDWGNQRYGTTGGHHIPATASFLVRWDGVLSRARRRHEAQRWVGEYIQTTATIIWSARENHFKFDSDPAHTSKSSAAVMGRHRNGVFFA